MVASREDRGAVEGAAEGNDNGTARRADRERSFSRREVLKTGGWSVPVVLGYSVPKFAVVGSRPPQTG